MDCFDGVAMIFGDDNMGFVRGAIGSLSVLVTHDQNAANQGGGFKQFPSSTGAIKKATVKVKAAWT